MNEKEMIEGDIVVEQIETMTVQNYLEALASPRFPGPASGSAAATTAGMAAALLEMSYHVTKKKFTKAMPIDEADIKRLRHHCLELATKDMEALEELIQVMKSKERDAHEYERALQYATDPLVSIVSESRLILNYAEKLLPICDKRALPELTGCQAFSKAAITAAKVGIESNLHLLQDDIYKKEVESILHHD